MSNTTKVEVSPRTKLTIPVRFISRYDEETTGMLIDISDSGFSMQTTAETNIGDPVIAYPENLGRLTGKVARIFEGGIAVQMDMTTEQKHHLRKRIDSAISGVPYIRMLENRKSKTTDLNLGSEAVDCIKKKIFYCHIVDISKTGSKIRSIYTPEIGSPIQIGKLHGVVKRYTEDGFAISFTKATRIEIEQAKSLQGIV